ncbi:DUF481 domain-containing protein [Cyanothece sp. BG0011]|uniref:DUF481 domain-containing protein n=1 Tax=Cyanothece sp. BG0011 TaxID=2082950 RepID=UPI0018E584BB|nr:DUF481 domain-containing protein [Cyanothece sp. BG0011]
MTNQSFYREKRNLPKILTKNDDTNKNAQLNRRLEGIEAIEDSPLKVMLLNDLALSYAKINNIDQALALLSQSLSITKTFEDMVSKITTLGTIAINHHKIGKTQRGIKILDQTIEQINSIENQSLQGQLLLNIGFKYEEMGQKKRSQTLFAQSQTLIEKASQPLPEYPFLATETNLKLGLTGNFQSFRDTTAAVGINLNLYKQWTREDIAIDGSLFLNFDSSRAVNNYRPNSLIFSSYRRHFDDQWSFFANVFNSTNQDLFAAKNDDEDLTIISNLLIGAGLNLWRGNSPRDFLDFQVGIGPRYEYDFIDFEERQNNIHPTLGVLLLGRNFSVGKTKLNQTFAIIPALDDLNNYTITSDTNLSIPISDQWFLRNRVFMRYRNEVIYEDNPQLEFLFTTGVQYAF